MAKHPLKHREKREHRKEAGRFVVQQHAASSAHYDFRLEVDGVLKSWAVPKGPSLRPQDRRLAIMTEDHSVEYAAFEGSIPAGSYGAGTVLVWDTGTYLNLRENKTMAASIEEGHIVVWLKGRKLRGGFALIRARRDWLLIKMSDLEAENIDVLQLDRSVISGRTMAEIEQAERARARILERIPQGTELE